MGAKPSKMSQEDSVALAQRARQAGAAVLDPAQAQKLEERLKSDPRDAFAHQALGFYYRHGSRDLAKAAFHGHEAVRLDPKNASAKWELGQTLIRAGRRDEALRTFEKMAEAKVQGTGLARQFAEEDVALGRQWAQRMRGDSKLGLPRSPEAEARAGRA